MIERQTFNQMGDPPQSSSEAVWSWAECAVAGRSHESHGLPCQDSTAVLATDDCVCVCLSDGAGSASFSDQGSSLAVTRVSELLSRSFSLLWESTSVNISHIVISDVCLAIDQLAKSTISDAKQFACTLLFVAVSKCRFIAGHLGDGIIVCMNSQGQLALLSEPERGEFANTTFFVTSSDAEKRLRVYRGYINDIDGFLLASDGAAESLYSRAEKTLAPACGTMLNWLQEHDRVAVANALCSNTSELLRQRTSDDCSLVLLRRIVSLDRDVETQKVAEPLVKVSSPLESIKASALVKHLKDNLTMLLNTYKRILRMIWREYR